MKGVNRLKVLEKCGSRCAYCGCEITLKTMQVDHVLSRRNFDWHIVNKFKIPEHLTHLTISDVDHLDNLLPSCRSCNNYKGANNLEAFRDAIQRQPQVMRTNQPMIRLAERYGLISFDPKPVIFYFETLNN